MAHTYDVGTKAWQPDPNEGWVASEVEQKLVDGDKVKLVFKLVNGEVRTANSIVQELETDPILPDERSPHHSGGPQG